MPIDWTRRTQQHFIRRIIKTKRLEAGLSQGALASEVGCTRQIIRNVEGDDTREDGTLHGCRTETLLRIAERLEIPLSALEPPNDPSPDGSGLTLGFPKVMNFRPSSYPGLRKDSEILDEPLMMIICPTSFRVTGHHSMTVEKVTAELLLGEESYSFDLRTWADLVKAGPQLKEADEFFKRLDQEGRPIRNRGDEASAKALADAAWAAQAPAKWSQTIGFQTFTLKRGAEESMEACFRPTGRKLSWGDFLRTIEPDDDYDSVSHAEVTICAWVRPKGGEPAASIRKVHIEGRCLRRVKHWVENRRPEGHFVRMLQPRIVEGEELYCGGQTDCCFQPDDECYPARVWTG